jgi:hypothetical protein
MEPRVGPFKSTFSGFESRIVVPENSAGGHEHCCPVQIQGNGLTSRRVFERDDEQKPEIDGMADDRPTERPFGHLKRSLG